MRRYRRLVLIDRMVPVLAALVGLIALAGAMVVQLNGEARTQAVTAELASLKASLDSLTRQSSSGDGTAEGLLALQDRMNRLESDWQARQGGAATADTPAAAADTPAEAAVIDPNLPTTDCIPLGTRFMVTPNETYPLCQSRYEVTVGGITSAGVDVNGIGSIASTATGTLPGSNCTVAVLSADAAGFAELRVSCT